jgi:hypothetical protein
LPWVESILDEKGDIHYVGCKICTFVEGKQKLLTPKFSNLLKHRGHKKAKVSMFDIDVSTFYYMQNKLNACSK